MARVINFYIPLSYQRKIPRCAPGSLGKIIPFASASRRVYRSTVSLDSGERYRVTIGSPSAGILSLFSGKL